MATVYESKYAWDNDINALGGQSNLQFVLSPYSQHPSANSQKCRTAGSTLNKLYSAPNIVVEPSERYYYKQDRTVPWRSNDEIETRYSSGLLTTEDPIDTSTSAGEEKTIVDVQENNLTPSSESSIAAVKPEGPVTESMTFAPSRRRGNRRFKTKEQYSRTMGIKAKGRSPRKAVKFDTSAAPVVVENRPSTEKYGIGLDGLKDSHFPIGTEAFSSGPELKAIGSSRNLAEGFPIAPIYSLDGAKGSYHRGRCPACEKEGFSAGSSATLIVVIVLIIAVLSTSAFCAWKFAGDTKSPTDTMSGGFTPSDEMMII